MHFKIKMLNKLLLISTIFLGVSCGRGIKFDPDFYKADFKIEGIINEHGTIVFADEFEFNNYACMSKEKIKELAVILSKARLPKKIKKEIKKNLSIL